MTQHSKHARRHQIAERDGWRCNFCRRWTHCPTCKPHGSKALRASLDHIIPKSQGGTESLANLAIACQPCNEAKGDGIWPDERQRVLRGGIPAERTERETQRAPRGSGSNRYTRKFKQATR